MLVFFYWPDLGGIMLLTICPHCSRKYKQGGRCGCRRKQSRERNKVYDQTKRNKESYQVYHSTEWKCLVERCKASCNGLDLYALYAENKIRLGQTAHHIEEILECPELTYELSNLIYVNFSSHNKIHHAYNKSELEKNKMKEFLRECLMRYRGEA